MTTIAEVGNALWSNLPHPARQAVKEVWRRYAEITGPNRVLPDYVIIGAQRGGTSSLYSYIVQHPGVARALTKEISFFDLNYWRGMRWYRSHFPSIRYKRWRQARMSLPLIVGEATPDYLFHPHAAARVFSDVPSTRLISILRNPVDRAYSHYQHQVVRGHETLSFEEALDREPERLGGELEKMINDETYNSFGRHHYSYLARGRYLEQLQRWIRLFGRDRLLILRSEDLFQSPSRTFHEVVEFLRLPKWEPPRYPTYNAIPTNPMDPGTRRRLIDYFRPYNEELYGYLGRDLGWDDDA